MIDWDKVRYFRRHEFGQSGDIEPDAELVRLLDEARHYAGIPFVVTSGIRSPERNTEVGGAPTSAHLTGHAVDIRCPTSRHRHKILEAAMMVGFRRIGIGQGFLHLDTDPAKAQDIIWLYD